MREDMEEREKMFNKLQGGEGQKFNINTEEGIDPTTFMSLVKGSQKWQAK